MQTAVTPVFLLTGIGALLNVMMSRLGRIKDRERLIYSLVHMASGEDYILVNEAMKKLRIIRKSNKFRICRDRVANEIRRLETSEKKQRNFFDHMKGFQKKTYNCRTDQKQKRGSPNR